MPEERQRPQDEPVKKISIIAPKVFYDYLITNEGYDNSFSLAAQNTYLDNKGVLRQKFDFSISNLSGDWFGNQTNYREMLEDDEYLTVGNFQYLNTVIDDAALFPQYSEIFKLEVIGFEKDREKLIEFFDEYANQVNNQNGTLLIDGESFDIVISLGQYSTPIYGDKVDIGGAERFAITMTFIVTVVSGIVTAKYIKIYHQYEGAGDPKGVPIPYISMKIQRDKDMAPDNRASEEKRYYYERSDMTLTLGGAYVKDEFCRKIMEYAIFPEKLPESFVKIFYEDTAISISKQFVLQIMSVNIDYQFGAPVTYSAVFKISVPEVTQNDEN